MTYRAKAAIEKIQKGYNRRLFQKCGVVSTGIGYKRVGGKKTDTLSLVCGVREKLPLGALTSSELIPEALDGINTDVVAVGNIKALETALEITERYRPTPGGVSVGHQDITAGTLGCWVKRGQQTVMLSNNHVLANSNLGEIGDPIYQPGPHDGGTSSDAIAELLDFVPVEFTDGLPVDCEIGDFFERSLNWLARLFCSQIRMKAYRQAEGSNLVDAAIAMPLSQEYIQSDIMSIGKIEGRKPAELGDKIQKMGRTTEYTTGEIEQVSVTVNVQYGEGKVAMFEDQLIAGAMSAGGDSGSAVLDMDRNLVGLLFAGSEELTVINRMEHVFDALGLSL